MSEAATPWGPRWVAAGLRARRADVVRERRSIMARRGVPEDVRRLAVAADDAIIAAYDAQIALLEGDDG